MNVLAIDIEGGHGGSSRSLFETLQAMQRSDLDLEVWCRRSSPLIDAYREMGAAATVWPVMPRLTAVAGLPANLVLLGRLLRQWPATRPFRRAATATPRDLIHLNHESLAPFARWLRQRSPAAIVQHIRTRPPPGLFARWQARTIAATADAVVFITENEQAHWSGLLGRPMTGTVVYNPVPIPAGSERPHPAIPTDDRFRVASLSNPSAGRGTDRILAIAGALRALGRTDIVFLVAGDLDGPDGRSLAAGVRAQGLEETVRLLGHVDRPQSVLAAADALIKPTREANPWGRDILEAMAAGLPVLSHGTETRFVETGETGVLVADLAPEAMAREIAGLADDRPSAQRLGEKARARVARLCDPAARAAEVKAIWQQAVDGRGAEWPTKRG